MKKNVPTQDQAQQPPVQGFIADLRAYLSADGEYLNLVLPGNMRVRKHKNFFLSILGVPFVPKAAQIARPEIDQG